MCLLSWSSALHKSYDIHWSSHQIHLMLKMKRKKNWIMLESDTGGVFLDLPSMKNLKWIVFTCCYYHVGIHLPCDIHIFKGESTAWMVLISFRFDNNEMENQCQPLVQSQRITFCCPFASHRLQRLLCKILPKETGRLSLPPGLLLSLYRNRGKCCLIAF